MAIHHANLRSYMCMARRFISGSINIEIYICPFFNLSVYYLVGNELFPLLDICKHQGDVLMLIQEPD